MNFLKSEYNQEKLTFKQEYCKLFWILLIGTIIIPVAVHFLGLYIYKSNPESVTKVSAYIQAAMAGIGDISKDSNAMVMLKIFANNARVSLRFVMFGSIPLVYFPMFAYLTNMALIGLVTSLVVNLSGVSVIGILAGLVPHGIFEIPAIVYATVLGVVLCKEMTKALWGKEHKPFNELFYNAARGYCLVVVPLLMIAGFVESFITPIIMNLFA